MREGGRGNKGKKVHTLLYVYIRVSYRGGAGAPWDSLQLDSPLAF